jgi:hypothetical protein
MNNRYELYNLKPRINPIIYLLFSSLISLVIYYSINYHIYDYKEMVGLSECNNKSCTIKMTLSYENIDIMNKNPEIVINNKIYQIKKITEDEPYLLNGIPSTDITLEINPIKTSNIAKFKIRYNKQRITKKIKDIITERS